MSDAQELSRRIFEEVWNDKSVATIDELMAPDYVHHDPQSPKFSGGIEGYKQLVTHYLKAFPDAHFTIDQEIQEGDVSVTRRRRHTQGRPADITCHWQDLFCRRNHYRPVKKRKTR